MKDYKETLTRARDVVKKMAAGIEFLIFAEENQHRIHYVMTLRNMLYDAMGYLKEYQQITRKHRSYGERLAKDEFLSGLRKGDRLHPIISLTIYYGESDWDGPLSLRDMIVDMPVSSELLTVIGTMIHSKELPHIKDGDVLI